MSTSRESNLLGRRMPCAVLPLTTGDALPLSDLTTDPTVIFVYPKTGDPNRPDSAAWAAIPGAKGCTAEACSFRDLCHDFKKLGWNIIGCSTQTTEYQTKVTTRLHLPYPLLSDTKLVLADSLGLQTFDFEGAQLYRRITLLVHDGKIVDVVDPRDDPTGHVEEVLDAARTLTAHT